MLNFVLEQLRAWMTTWCIELESERASCLVKQVLLDDWARKCCYHACTEDIKVLNLLLWIEVGD